MRNPMHTQREKQRYLLLSISLYILIVLYFCHWGYLKGSGSSSAELILEAADHLLSHPFQIFPLQWEALAAGLLTGLVASLLVYSKYLSHQDLRPGTENGSDKWNTDIKGFRREYAETPLTGSGSRNMILTNEIFLSMDTRKTERNCNIMCIGAAGTQKSRGLIIPNILQSNCSYVIADPSGELLKSTGVFLRREGYEIRVFNLVELAHSDRYNPFRYIQNQEDVVILVDTLLKNTKPKDSKTGDPFWEDAAKALLTALCYYAISVLPKEEQNFSTVMKLLRLAESANGQPSILDGLFADLAKAEPEHIAVTSYAVFKAAGGGKTAQSILITCQTRLQAFNLDAIKALTDTDTMDLGTVGDKKVAIFCIMPITHSAYNFLISLMFAQLFQVLYRHAETECPENRLPCHVRFLMDEFANYGQLPEFPQKLSTMRKYEISCTIVLQALSQLKGMYKDEWETIVSNCDSMLFLGTSDKTTLEYISQSLGKETIRTINSSLSKGPHGNYSTSYNKTGRELMTPTELRRMNNRNCIYLLRGLDPFFSVKFKLEKHPNYRLSGAGSKECQYDVKKEKTTLR